MGFISAHSTVILAALFFLSEGLALVPSINANSVFQLIFGWFKKQQPAQ